MTLTTKKNTELYKKRTQTNRFAHCGLSLPYSEITRGRKNYKANVDVFHLTNIILI